MSFGVALKQMQDIAIIVILLRPSASDWAIFRGGMRFFEDFFGSKFYFYVRDL